MKSVSLTAYPRTLKRRTGLKQLRKSGRIPAVIYGRHAAPENLEIGGKDLENLILHSVSENILVDLSVPENGRPKRLALVQEIQHHPLTGVVLHLDLHEVVENEKVTITVPVETVGEAVGVKTGGGVLEHVLFKLKVRALPKDLPEFIQVDVSGLNIGQSVHIGDIKPVEGVEILGDKRIVVLAVAEPKAEVQETTEEVLATAAPAQPEMIKEKKDDSSAEAPAKGAEKTGEKPEKKAEKKK